MVWMILACPKYTYKTRIHTHRSNKYTYILVFWQSKKMRTHIYLTSMSTYFAKTAYIYIYPRPKLILQKDESSWDKKSVYIHCLKRTSIHIRLTSMYTRYFFQKHIHKLDVKWYGRNLIFSVGQEKCVSILIIYKIGVHILIWQVCIPVILYKDTYTNYF